MAMTEPLKRPVDPLTGHLLSIAAEGSLCSVAIGQTGPEWQGLRQATAAALPLAVVAAPERGVRRRKPRAPMPPRAMAQALLLTDDVLAAAGLARTDLAAVAVAVGPGGFTAVRSLVALVQGVAAGLGIGVLPVCSLRAEAARYPVAPGTTVLVARDARQGECFGGVFRSGSMDPNLPDATGGRSSRAGETVLPAALWGADEWIRQFDAQLATARDGDAAGSGRDGGDGGDGVVLVGDGFEQDAALSAWRQERGLPWLPPRVSSSPTGGDGVWAAADRGTADTLAAAVWRLAQADRQREGEAAIVSASALRPLYLRERIALDVDEQRQLRVRA